jgi:high-affinity nickel-transport protein
MILATIRDVRAALAYLLVFGLGTVAGMFAVTFAMAVPMSWMARANVMQRHVGRVAGLVSVAFGFVVIWRIVAAW